MKTFIKQNWFKIAVLIAIFWYVWDLPSPKQIWDGFGFNNNLPMLPPLPKLPK